VLDPYQQVEIRGWRKSYSDVAEFYFTDLPDSYAARTGRPENVGVIGVAAFREKQRPPIAYTPPPPPYYPPYTPAPYDQEGYAQREDSAKSAAESSNSAADAAASGGSLARAEARAPSAMPQQIGTGHGARRYDPVTQTEFERASWRPNQRVTLYYDSHEALVSKGIIRDRYYDYARTPNAFPSGFAPDPN